MSIAVSFLKGPLDSTITLHNIDQQSCTLYLLVPGTPSIEAVSLLSVACLPMIIVSVDINVSSIFIIV